MNRRTFLLGLLGVGLPLPIASQQYKLASAIRFPYDHKISIAPSPIVGVRRVWANGELVYSDEWLDLLQEGHWRFKSSENYGATMSVYVNGEKSGEQEVVGGNSAGASHPGSALGAVADGVLRCDNRRWW